MALGIIFQMIKKNLYFPLKKGIVQTNHLWKGLNISPNTWVSSFKPLWCTFFISYPASLPPVLCCFNIAMIFQMDKPDQVTYGSYLSVAMPVAPFFQTNQVGKITELLIEWSWNYYP